MASGLLKGSTLHFREGGIAGQSARAFVRTAPVHRCPAPFHPCPSAPLLKLLRRFGADAMSFLAVESTMKQWSEASEGSDSDAIVSFDDTVRPGSPRARRSPRRRGSRGVARAFVQSAREKGRRACFFATESSEIEGFARLLLGEQPVWDPAAWPGMPSRPTGAFASRFGVPRPRE